jgi:hypothetical protein
MPSGLAFSPTAVTLLSANLVNDMHFSKQSLTRRTIFLMLFVFSKLGPRGFHLFLQKIRHSNKEQEGSS